jgi:hypothetical protein
MKTANKNVCMISGIGIVGSNTLEYEKFYLLEYNTV